MAWNETQWERSAKRLPKFLSPLVQDLGRSERRVGATLYVEGLLMPGQRKSIGPMAERLGVDSQKLQQFITDSPWDESAIWKAIRPLAVDCLEPLEAWIVDETGWLKQGEHSVGVSHQYCGAVGKSANCQVNVQVAITDGRVAVPVGAQLYLPQSWTQDRARCRAAGVPDELAFATKPQIALALIKESLADGVVRAPVLGDNSYGINGEFRDELRRLRLEFFLQVDADQITGWAHPVTLEKKRTRWHVPEDTPPAPTLMKLFAAQKAVKWHPCSWKTADGQTRHTRLAWLRVYLPGALERGAQSLEEVWLVVDWPKEAA
jgi:SRSO17 transposase